MIKIKALNSFASFFTSSTENYPTKNSQFWAKKEESTTKLCTLQLKMRGSILSQLHKQIDHGGVPGAHLRPSVALITTLLKYTT